GNQLALCPLRTADTTALPRLIGAARRLYHSCSFVVKLASILPPGFGDANVSTQGNQSNRRDRRRQSKNQPHRSGMSRAVLRTKRSQQPATGADQEFTHEEWKIRERAVRRLLSFRCNRGGILVHTRRIERFADREHDQVKRSHNVVRVN